MTGHSVGTGAEKGVGLRPPHCLQSGDWPPYFCINYCVANIITNNFISDTDNFSSNIV